MKCSVHVLYNVLPDMLTCVLVLLSTTGQHVRACACVQVHDKPRADCFILCQLHFAQQAHGWLLYLVPVTLCPAASRRQSVPVAEVLPTHGFYSCI